MAEKTLEDKLLEDVHKLEQNIFYLLNRIFKYCKSNPGQQLFVPIDSIRRCEAFGSEDSDSSNRCMRMTPVRYYDRRDVQRKVYCKKCADDMEIPF